MRFAGQLNVKVYPISALYAWRLKAPSTEALGSSRRPSTIHPFPRLPAFVTPPCLAEGTAAYDLRQCPCRNAWERGPHPAQPAASPERAVGGVDRGPQCGA